MEIQLQELLLPAVFAIAMVKIFRGPIGSAIAERIRGQVGPADDPALAADVDHLRVRLAEVEERLDFAERLLAQAREADQLSGGTHR